jgi:hypothetical protein
LRDGLTAAERFIESTGGSDILILVIGSQEFVIALWLLGTAEPILFVKHRIAKHGVTPGPVASFRHASR